MPDYPKRLIEVDLPIKRISAHARREKSIRHGHISTLHIWWARRPLAACRAVICAALWPDPADEHCPQSFRDAAANRICAFAEKARTDSKLVEVCSQESWSRWRRTTPASLRPADPACWADLRYALLDFIADFANWDASTVPAYLETARVLTQAAHEALGGEPGTRPLVVDPFAGGGTIPLEALRVGADAFASDLNPVAVLLNKVVLEYIPKYGQRLADEVRKWGTWVKEQAEKELAEFYPKDPDGSTPIAYLWARTITCEGPGCGTEVPLIGSMWLSTRSGQAAAIRLMPNRARRTIGIEIVENPEPRSVGSGTVLRRSATCPCCGYTTPVKSVRDQLKSRHGGTRDVRLIAVVMESANRSRRYFRAPAERDVAVAQSAADELTTRVEGHGGDLPLIPDEKLDTRGIRHTWAMVYGLESWHDYFTPRQALALTSLARIVSGLPGQIERDGASDIAGPVQVCLALAVDRGADYWSSLAIWAGEFVAHTFGRQAIPFVSDFAEVCPFREVSGSWGGAVDWISRYIARESMTAAEPGLASQASAIAHPLPDDSCDALITDPPYYDSVAYSYLSDYFYVWLRRSLGCLNDPLLSEAAVPKDDEIIVDRPHQLSKSTKDVSFYESSLTKAFGEGRRIVTPSGIGVIVFANKSTSGWEAVLRAIVESGWVVTGSWPIDTERQGRISARDQARLQSSIHVVCRPRENSDGSVAQDTVGDWRDVLDALPRRIHDWLPRLVEEGIVGADAIFACLGPALEIYSRYSRVEKASGEPVKLGDYLEQVWAAVSREALSLLFRDPSTSGLEADARLTAMWLWTLSTANSTSAIEPGEGGDAPEVESEEEEGGGKQGAGGRYALEFDAARKIAQGLGAHFDKLGHVVEIKGDTARLLSVAERTHYLFGSDAKDGGKPAPKPKKQKAAVQLGMFEELSQAEEETSMGITGTPPPGTTVLDRVHQSMILFGAGRSDALRRFLIDDGVGAERAFWSLAQSLSALYPSGSDEKRWVDGVLARKRGLGF